MENFLENYMRNRLHSAQQQNQSSNVRPVLTISREYGCPSQTLAEQLAATLNKRNPSDKKPVWHYVNKEILEESANKLDMGPDKVKHIMSNEGKSFMDDLFSSFSSNYHSNLRIKKTIIEVIKSISQDGHVIIIGRGSVAIVRNLPFSLHIRLQAPVEWRAGMISGRKKIPVQEAIREITEIDHERTRLIEYFLNRKFDNTLFDLIFNCETLTIEEIVQTIIRTMEVKNLL